MIPAVHYPAQARQPVMNLIWSLNLVSISVSWPDPSTWSILVMAGPVDLVNPGHGILNSVSLAWEVHFIRVVDPGMTVSQKDWIEPGSRQTWRGLGNLW